MVGCATMRQALVATVKTNHPIERIEVQTRHERLLPNFLRGYREVRPIGEADIQATWYFVAIRQVWLLGLHTGNGQDWGFGWMNDPYFDQALKFFREWDDTPFVNLDFSRFAKP